MRTLILATAAAAVLGAADTPWTSVTRAATAQVELDRILGEVNSRIITETDVRQARALQLVDDVSSEASVRRALEERILVLGEITRSAPVVVTDADLAARRGAWEARVGGSDRARAMLAGAGMSEAALQTWLRDDARIQVYLKRQFGVVPDTDRQRATTDWLLRLRQRAGLK
jgi:hypothetical protein